MAVLYVFIRPSVRLYVCSARACEDALSNTW